MKFLIFYDDSGTVYFTMSVDEAPAGLEKFVFDIPEGSTIDGMDMSDPDHPVPKLSKPEPVVDYNEEIANLQAAVAELYETLM